MVNDGVEDTDTTFSESKEYARRATETFKLFMNPPKVDVGTSPSEIVYRDGKMRLLHYIPAVPKPHKVPLLIIYALVNKPYILDLQPDRSVVKRLLEEGFEVYLIDWGTPTATDRFFTLDDYVNWYINDVVDLIREKHGSNSISLLGYCMGGPLSVMFAALHPEKVKNLILMAAPLDFDADSGLLKHWSRMEYFNADKLVDAVGNVPGEFLNAAFLLLDPVKNMYLKYLKFMDKIDDREFVELFFRMERWIFDGIPVAGEAYREFIKYCYQQNLLVKSELKLNGRKVEINRIKMPVLSLIAKYDHLVPPESSSSFNAIVPSSDKEMIIFNTGHIGLSVSSVSHAELWPKVAKWLKKRSGAVSNVIRKPVKRESRKQTRKRVRRNPRR